MDEKRKELLISIIVISLGALVIIGGFFTYNVITPPVDHTPKVLTVYFFYGAECPHCHNVMPVIDNLTEKYPDVDFQRLEVWHNQTNNNLANKMLLELGEQYQGVPLVIIGKTVLLGGKDIPEQLEEKIIINKIGK